MFLDQSAQPLCHDFRGAVGGFRQQQRKFLAAGAGDNIGLAPHHGAVVGDGLEHQITGVVAEAVVDRFEIVDVDRQERQRPAIALKTSPLEARQCLEVPAVIDRGQPVRGGEQFKARGKPFRIAALAHRGRQPAHQQHDDHKNAGGDISELGNDEERGVAEDAADRPGNNPY